MTPSNEAAIEQYIRRPDAMSEEAQCEVERLLDRDPGAAAFAAFLRGFYDRLDEEARTAAAAQVDAFVEDLFAEDPDASVISLQPFQPRREARPTVLAAETETSSEARRFSVLTTLAAEAEQMLVRIVGDREKNQGRMYVLTDPPEQRAHVVVSFPELGLDLVANEQGRLAFDLPPDVGPEQWNEVRAVVRRPVAREQLSPGNVATLPLPSGTDLHCERDGGVITASAADDNGAPTFVTVTPPDETPLLMRLGPGATAHRETDTEAPVILRVYE
jgi:hypothetical protein